MNLFTRVSVPLQIAAGANNACAVTPNPVAPEFLVSLNTCTPPDPDQPQMTENAKTIEAILVQIVARLGGKLDPIWNGPNGHDPYWQTRSACTPEENERIQVEEEWARWCTELQAGTVYGTATGYGPTMTDVFFYKAFHDSNPVVPVRMACQQLCTYPYYSRGLTFDKVQGGGSYGVTAGPNGYLSALFKGKWDQNGKYANIPAAFGRPAGPMGGPWALARSWAFSRLLIRVMIRRSRSSVQAHTSPTSSAPPRASQLLNSSTPARSCTPAVARRICNSPRPTRPLRVATTTISSSTRPLP